MQQKQSALCMDATFTPVVMQLSVSTTPACRIKHLWNVYFTHKVHGLSQTVHGKHRRTVHHQHRHLKKISAPFYHFIYQHCAAKKDKRHYAKAKKMNGADSEDFVILPSFWHNTAKQGKGTYSSLWINPWQSYEASPAIWDQQCDIHIHRRTPLL